MGNKKNVILVLVALIGLFFLGAYFFNKNESKSIESLTSKKDNPFVRDYSFKTGQNKNSVVIVEFMDPQCVACKAFHPAVKNILLDYEEEVLFVVKYLANHKNSKQVVKILEAARLQNKFKETQDIIFEYQEIWASNFELIWNYLPQAKLDIVQLKKDLLITDVTEILKQDRLDATTLKVTGSPSFYVNGKKLKKYSLDGLIDLVESELYK